MSKITVYTKEGKKAGDIEIDSAIFEAKINGRMLELVNRLYANNKRTGNAHTKTRAEVRGGGKKPWRQKGTGRARVSSIRSPLWRGGGTVFGPRTREIYNVIPKQIRKKALISALSKKFKEKSIVVVDDISFDEPKTKLVYRMLSKLKIEGKNTLMFMNEHDEMVERASRNIAKLSFKKASDANAYHVLRKQILLFDKKGIKAIEEKLLTIHGNKQHTQGKGSSPVAE
ncbi:MAG: 50S ribosomal protein L4 [Candidatus Omnitrophica bacterium]|nr:50S ribosomal protein L4 [Candidatus Omnitrophota bacterium]